MTDDELMARAGELALEGVRQGHGGPFGAVVARDGEILGEGCNRVLVDNDPTAHAEVLAVRAACRALGQYHLAGCVLYTSCEPCPMCLAAIHWARLDAVHYALSRDDAARIGFDDARLYAAMEQPLVPVTPLPHQSARAAFDAWEALPDRRDY